MSEKNKTQHKETLLVHTGRHPEDNHGVVNPPVYHASTILYPTVEHLENFYKEKVVYGRYGTPGTFAFEEAMVDLEGGDHCLIAACGMQAISTALLAFLKTGDHVLMVDSTYEPTRAFCDGFLKRMGIETTYYDPLIGENITSLMRPETRVVFTESPGSLTFEVQDIPAISKAAKSFSGSQQEVIVMMDNTWATPLLFQALEKGVDVSIQAVTKYIGGHADVMLGSITCKEAHWDEIQQTRRQIGLSVPPDDVYLALRGLRTLSVRLKQHEANALEVAHWLAERPEVSRVYFPALPDDPGHALWKRDFEGSCGLFGFALHEGEKHQVDAFLSAMSLFGMGFSWGGYESLLIPARPQRCRTATTWNPGGPYFRIHVGLENPADIISELDNCFSKFHGAKG